MLVKWSVNFICVLGARICHMDQYVGQIRCINQNVQFDVVIFMKSFIMVNDFPNDSLYLVP
jgi:hypothetical protein